MNDFAIEGDHKRIVTWGREGEVIERNRAHHAKVLLAATFARRNIDQVVNVVGQQAVSVCVLEADIKADLLTLRRPRNPKSKPNRQRVMPDGEMSNKKGVPPTPQDIELPVDGLHRVGENGELESRTQAAFGDRLGISFHLERLYMPLLCPQT